MRDYPGCIPLKHVTGISTSQRGRQMKAFIAGVILLLVFFWSLSDGIAAIHLLGRERVRDQPTGGISYALLGFKIASVVVLGLAYIVGFAEAVHRIWSAAFNAEFGTKPFNPTRVIALNVAGFLVFGAGVLLSLPFLAILLWGVAEGGLWG